VTIFGIVQVGIIERALENGSSVLIENMGETVDAVLNPVITRSTFKKGRSVYVKLGDKDVEYNPKFRLVMHTKLSNPHYPPEIQAETTLINFTVTEVGLEDQLLALTVNKERPDLETTKIQLVNQNTEFTIRLKQLEDDLLLRLSSAEGDLTEDVELIESLEESKRVADDITVKVAEARETEKMIMVARNKYRMVASRGSMLFFLLNSLNKIHAFYQFSLNAFVIVFARGIDKAPFGHATRRQSERALAEGAPAAASKAENHDSQASAPNEQANTANVSGRESTPAPAEEEEDYSMTPEDLERRLTALTSCTTFTVFDYTRRGLFDRDKLIVTCLLTFRILLRDKKIDATEYEALTSGKKNPTPPPAPNDLSRWISEGQWAALDVLCASVPAFGSFAKEMDKSSDDWEKWCGHEHPEAAKMPGEWGKPQAGREQEVKRKFRELLIMRVLRPDRITNALSKFCEIVMGAQYTNQPTFSCESMMPESSCQTPIFFVLFPGYSPSKEVEAYANKHGRSVEAGNLTLLSMGQGQEKPAEACLDRYISEGGWVFLDNVHLMQGWVPRLERKLEVAFESANKDFRCFFSAEPINGAPFAKIVPESILQVRTPLIGQYLCVTMVPVVLLLLVVLRFMCP
jgi:dynein heavy chain, axonemal